MHEGRIGIVCLTYLTIKSSDYPLPVCALTTTYRTNNIVLPETNLITTMDGKSTFLVTIYRDQILEKKWIKIMKIVPDIDRVTFCIFYLKNYTYAKGNCLELD